MFIKSELLKIPIINKIPSEHEERALKVQIQDIKNCPTLCLTFYKDGEAEITVFFQQDKWINYIHKEEKFIREKLFYNWNSAYHISTYHNCTVSNEELKLMSDYLQTKNTLNACLGKLCDIQRQKSYQETCKEIEKQKEKRFELREVIKSLPLPQLTSEEELQTKFYGDRVVTWTEQDDCWLPVKAGYCTKCGHEVYESYIFAELGNCQNCGCWNRLKLSKNKTLSAYGHIAKLYQQDSTVYFVVYRVDKNIQFVKKGKYYKNGFIPVVSYDSYPSDIFIVTDSGVHQMAAWESFGMMGNTVHNRGKEWFYKSIKIYPDAVLLDFNEEILYSSALKNSHLKEYISQKDISFREIIKYVSLYLKYPNIENLLTNGYINFVNSLVNNNKNTSFLDLKKAKLKDITGLNKDELKRAKDECWNFKMLKTYREYRDKKGMRLDIRTLTILSEMNFDAISRYTQDVLGTAYYIAGQNSSVRYWLDYIEMAKKLEYDISSKEVQRPHSLVKAHDAALQKVDFIEDKTLIKKFRELAETLNCLNYDNGQICIQAPKRERDLILEGKILDHCVGGYGKDHCLGQSIFFVRKSESPDTPWYTLQVNLKTGDQLQLHGYKNDREQPIPQQVKDFVNYWLKNIFVRFDVDKMEFIKKQKTAV